MLSPTSALVSRLTRDIDTSAVSVEEADRERASQDFSWLSPILTANLPATTADVVVAARTSDEVRRSLDASYSCNVAVTPRGAGTGNYGQSVPLEGGLVIDLSKMSDVLEIGDGWIEAETGAQFTELEVAANSTGQELALYPSTAESTLGGFIAGGAGGTGSLENGFSHQGFVLGMSVLPCVEASEESELEGDDLAAHVHTYGVAGIMTKARIRLLPMREWSTVWATFESLGDAAGVGRELMTLDPLPRLLSVSEADLVATFPRRLAIPRDKVSLRAIVDASVRAEVERLVRSAGGTVEELEAKQELAPSLLSFNHITLWAKQADPDIFHLQGRGRPDDDASKIRECVPGVRIHLDGLRYGDTPGFAAMLVAPFHSEPSVRESIQSLRDSGVDVIDPHTWKLGEHIRSSRAAQQLLQTATTNDPRGLLNPGRLEPVEAIAARGD